MINRFAALTALVLTTGMGFTAPATAATAEDECLRPPGVTFEGGYAFKPVLTNVPLQVPIEVSNLSEISRCGTMTAVVQKADGRLRTTVTMDRDSGTGHPPTRSKYGYLTVNVADGAGDWVITSVSYDGRTLATRVPFRVLRGRVITMSQPATTAGAARTTVRGIVRNYSPTGALVPTAGAAVRVMHQNGVQVIATARTAATGWFTVSVPFTRTTTMYTTAPETTVYDGARSGLVTATKLLVMSNLAASAVGYVQAYWKVSGTAFPGRLWTALDLWNGSAWESTQSFGQTAANGSYARYWKPNRPGTFRLRVTVSGGPLGNSPQSRQVSVTVRQLPQQPTYLDGIFAPTADEPARYQTRMSTFGHLKIRRADGTFGPVADQVVEILVKRPADTAWQSVGGGRTTSTGYYYSNWFVPFQAGDTVTVLARYTTALPRAASTSQPLGTFIVQP